MRIVVSGATGNVGRRLIPRLRAQGYGVRAVVPPGERVPFEAGAGLETAEADFGRRDSLARALDGADAYFLMSPAGERQMEWQRAQVDSALAAGIGRVVKLSAYESAPDSEWQLGRWHWDGECALRESGLTHAILRPQYFQQNLLVADDALRAGRMITYIPPGREFGAVHAADIADVAAVLLTTEPLTGQVVVPTGPVPITTESAAAAVAQALGIDILVDYVDPDRARRELGAAGEPDWVISDLLNICLNSSVEVTDDVPRLTGHPARTIAEAAAEHFAG
jgi:uncharacterized protein YbjT (DUF2867 family)